MIDTSCEKIDEYLLHDLNPAAQTEFERHLTVCESCRLAIAQQARINELLKTATDAIPCPVELPARIRRESESRTPKRHSAIASLIAASLVVGLLGWSLVPGFRHEGIDREKRVSRQHSRVQKPTHIPDAEGNKLAVSQAKPRLPVRVEFPADMLSLPIESGEPDITLIQVFPVSRVSAKTP